MRRQIAITVKGLYEGLQTFLLQIHYARNDLLNLNSADFLKVDINCQTFCILRLMLTYQTEITLRDNA